MILYFCDINFVMKKAKSDYLYFLIILFISIAAYFWMFLYAPIYDFADEFFPGRYFMFEAIHHNIFPIWLPYQSMGLPVHADPQSGTFYLPLWILSIFGGYSPFTWGIEFVLHVFLAGSGFFLLTRRFVDKKSTALMVACCYILSGFFVGNAQHISWIIAATWVPWVLNFLLAFFENPRAKNAVGMAVFASLLFTGGYPGFSFILFYLFVALFICYIFVNIKNKSYFKKLIPFLILAGVLCLLLILPSIISLVEIKSFITRGDTLSYSRASEIAFTPQSFISLLFPWVACSEGSFIKTDISMGTIYVGVLTIFFFFLGLFQKKSSPLKIIGYWGLFCLLLSLGNFLPVHKWAFFALPLFNLIRIPAIFRLFVIIAILLVAAKGFDVFISNFSQYKKRFLIFSITLLICFLLFSVVLMLEDKTIFQDFISFNFSAINNSSLYHKFFYESLFQILFLTVVLISIFADIKHVVTIVMFILIVDLGLNGWICTQRTGFMSNYTNKQFAEMLSSKPMGYPIPCEVTSCENLYSVEEFGPFWRNLGIFAKKIEWDSYIGVVLKKHEEMLTPYFKSGKRLSLSEVAFFPDEIIYSEKPLLLSVDSAYTDNRKFTKSYSDSNLSDVTIVRFNPGDILLATNTEIERTVVLCQNYYPGWMATTEKGESLKIEILDNSLMSVIVPKGSHQIEFTYRRLDILYSFMAELITWIGCSIFILIELFRKKKLKIITQ